MSITIRKNARKKIEAILNAAVLIREYKYDDSGDTLGAVTPARVIKAGLTDPQMDFERVYQDGDVTRFVIHRNWSFTAYATKEAARRDLTEQAYEKYFPAETANPTAVAAPAVGKYRVHLYPIVHVTVAEVTADSPEQARDKALAAVDCYALFDEVSSMAADLRAEESGCLIESTAFTGDHDMEIVDEDFGGRNGVTFDARDTTLAAAAPDMLQALRGIYDTILATYGRHEDGSIDVDNAGEKSAADIVEMLCWSEEEVKAAIAKAEGRG